MLQPRLDVAGTGFDIGQDYLDRGTEFYEQRQRHQQLQYLHKKAAQLGFQVVALPQTP
jgi:hypothetical protein